jgi:glucose/arabinose dehydrogenase
MKIKLLIGFLLFIVSVVQAQILSTTSFASGFSSVVEIVHPPNDSRLFVVEQGGIIKIVTTNGTTNSASFLNLSSAISTGGERGLLGLAFHPNYATNGWFFVNYTNTNGSTVIARYTVSSDANIANTSGTILMTVAQPFSNHNGGCLRFGPDGYLYISLGDGGSGGDPGNRAQNINENLGKMLRIDVNATVAPFYTAPTTNPYVGITGNDEIWAVGLRNAWKFSFDKLNGDIWIADVGQNNIEEINKVANPLPNNINFGWRCYEGNAVYNSSGCVAPSNLTFPVAQYDHSDGSCSITGGYVYRGITYGNLTGRYVFADYCKNRLGILQANSSIVYSANLPNNINITCFGEDKDGELYVGGGSTIYRVVDVSLATTSFENNGFTLYPNPAKDIVTISNKNGSLFQSIAIMDVAGKLVLSETANTSEKQITISNLQSGLYVLKVTDNGGKIVQTKFIKE